MSNRRASYLMANVALQNRSKHPVSKAIIINGGEPFLDPTFWYLTGLNSGIFEGSKAIISPGGIVDVVTSVLEAEAAEKGNCNVHVYHDFKEYCKIINELLDGAEYVGINAPQVPYGSIANLKKVRKGLKFRDISASIETTVSVKDEKEIKATEKACGITSEVAQALPSMLEEGMTEKEIAAEMDIRMKRLGGTGNAFDTIACFGANSSEPHHTPGDSKLKKGDTALFDFGAKYDMYCADLTRTIFYGDPGEKLKRAYEVVKEAQEAGIAQIRDHANAADVDRAAREIIDSTEFKGLFIHTFGHGIGMNVHQGISVYERSKQILRAGNIISAEPGIYIPGLGGIRIEDTVLVTKDGCRRLTKYDHELTIVQ